jgi:hypothetical protein
VQLDEDAVAPPGRRGEDERRPRRRPHYDDYEPDVQPHRGVLILVLGILSIVFSCIPLAGWVLGGAAMSMGSHDDRLMDARSMDRSGRTMTKAGQICGILGVFFSTLLFILNMVLFVNSTRHR